MNERRWNFLLASSTLSMTFLLCLSIVSCTGAEDIEKPGTNRKTSNALPEVESPVPIPNIGPSSPAVPSPLPSLPAPVGGEPVVMNPNPQLPSPQPMPPASQPMPSDKSEGCSAAMDLPEGEATFAQGELTRKYVIRKPSKYSRDKAWPLVLALHPNGSSAKYWDAESGNLAIRKEFGDKVIIVMAQARVNDWRGDLPTELAYFETVISKVKKSLCVDTKRIFSMGFSGGGSFSGVLGCNRKDIRAIASGGAVIYFDPKACVGTPAAWITIGDEEASAERLAFRDFWVKANSCKAESKVLVPATCLAYSCPDAARPTQFCSHKAGHVWPDFGTKVAWEFFSKF